MNTQQWNSSCKLYQTFDILGKKWSIFLIFLIGNGKSSYNDILKSLHGLNSKILAERLKQLEQEGFILRKIISERPIKIHYSLTEKGHDFMKIFQDVHKTIQKHEGLS